MESLFEHLSDKSKKAAELPPEKIAYDEDGNPYSLGPAAGTIEKLAPLDHSKIKYVKINKCFYKEAKTVSKRPWSEIAESRRAKSRYFLFCFIRVDRILLLLIDTFSYYVCNLFSFSLTTLAGCSLVFRHQRRRQQYIQADQ